MYFILKAFSFCGYYSKYGKINQPPYLIKKVPGIVFIIFLSTHTETTCVCMKMVSMWLH